MRRDPYLPCWRKNRTYVLTKVVGSHRMVIGWNWEVLLSVLLDYLNDRISGRKLYIAQE